MPDKPTEACQIKNFPIEQLLFPTVNDLKRLESMEDQPLLNLDHLDDIKADLIDRITGLHQSREFAYSQIYEYAIIALFFKNAFDSEEVTFSTTKYELYQRLLPEKGSRLSDQVNFHPVGQHRYVQVLAMKRLLDENPEFKLINTSPNRIANFELGQRYTELKTRLREEIEAIELNTELEEGASHAAIYRLYRRDIITTEELITQDALYQKYLSTTIYELIAELRPYLQWLNIS
jgi:hypothetical protein